MGAEFLYPYYSAFHWTEAQGLTLAISPSDAPGCYFHGVLANGISVGECGGSSFSEGVYWDASNGIQLLPGATNDRSYANGRAFSLSADGKFIAGLSSAGTATRWDAQNQPHAVSTLIPASLTASWSFAGGTAPVRISADGGAIAGTGTDPSSVRRAWIVRAN